MGTRKNGTDQSETKRNEKERSIHTLHGVDGAYNGKVRNKASMGQRSRTGKRDGVVKNNIGGINMPAFIRGNQTKGRCT